MRNLLFLFFLPLLFSCGGNSSEIAKSGNILENLTVSVDTVVMDPGDHLVNLQFGPALFGLSADEKRYYFMHRNSGLLSVYDLEEKKLIKQVQFEKEGPNAIPNFVYSFQLLNENRILLTGFGNLGIYDSAAVKQVNIPLVKDQFPGLSQEEGYTLNTGIKVSDQRQLSLSLPNDPKSERVSLAIFDLETQQGRMVHLPDFGYLTKFTLTYREGNSSTSAAFASLNLKMEQNRVLAFSSGTSSIYSFDLDADSLLYQPYSPILIPAMAEAPAISEFSSKEQFDESIRLARSQIFFGDILWDASREIYLRFASITKPNPNPELSAKTEVFLLAFDKDLNLVGESKMEELPSQPNLAFFKNGKLWSYVNVEDELGFAVMDFKF